MWRLALVLPVGLIATVHCGDDASDTTSASTTEGGHSDGGAGGTTATGGGGAGGDAPFGAAVYCEAIVDFFCDFYVRCGRMAVDSVEACRDPFLETCNAGIEHRYVDLEDAGLLSLDADGLAACEAHLDQVACEQQVFELTGPCAGVWRGHQPAGAACGLDVESFVCAPTTACVLGLDLCGECRTTAPIGGDCSASDTTCAADAFCDAGQCRARIQIGQPCGTDDRCVLGGSCESGACVGRTFVAVGESCDADRRCPYLAACIAGTCVQAARLGESCAQDALCESGRCGASGVCEAPLADGAPCSTGAHCASGSCDGQTCQPLPSGCFTP